MSVTTSSLTLTEVLTVPFKLGNIVYEREYRAMLLNTINITTEPVSIAIAEQAAHLRVKYALKTPDAIHIATAIVEHCDAFLTNDKRLKQVTEINILILEELELDPI